MLSSRCSSSSTTAAQRCLSHTRTLAVQQRPHASPAAATAATATQLPLQQQQQLGGSTWLLLAPCTSLPACRRGLRPAVVRAGGSGALSSPASTSTTATRDAAGPAAAAATPPNASTSASAGSQPASAGSVEEQQSGSSRGGGEQAPSNSTWEEEIEETLKLVQLLPPAVRGVLEGHSRLYELLEVVMDLGRPPTARFPGADERLADAPVTQEDLDYAVTQVGEFGGDNRAGIDATLHRISCLRNRAGRIVGLTCRVGRAIHGSAGLVADLVSGGASVLFMGRPGVGKTTAIRELSRLLADDLARRVVIVDTSNEIGGDGDVPHAGIGRARRMQVPDPEQQHRVMIEAVENHMPQVVVIDEIGTEAECSAARTIAQRGVQLVATAHGNELQNLVKNPALSDLIGGIQSVTLGDDEAKRRGVQKSILERAAPPTFDVAVEMLERSRWCVYTDVAAAVDSLLGGQHPGGEMRQRAPDGSITRYTFSRDRQQQQQQQAESEGALFGSRRGSSSGSSSSGRVLPELSASASGSGVMSDGSNGSSSGSSSSSPGGFLRRLFVSEDQDRAGSRTVTRRARAVQLGLPSPESAVLRLYASELDEERLWEVMSAMGLHDKVYMSPRPSEADAVLAVRSKLRSNAGLRQAARQAGVPVYAIKSGSSSNLVRAFRTLLGQEPTAGSMLGSAGSMDGDDVAAAAAAAAAAGATAAAGVSGGSSSSQQIDLAGSRSSEDDDDTDAEEENDTPPARPLGGAVRAMQEEEDGLEEAKLAAEQIVLPLQQPVELLPRSESVRKAQAALCETYGLTTQVVGSGADARLRVSCAAGAGGGEQEV